MVTTLESGNQKNNWDSHGQSLSSYRTGQCQGMAVPPHWRPPRANGILSQKILMGHLGGDLSSWVPTLYPFLEGPDQTLAQRLQEEDSISGSPTIQGVFEEGGGGTFLLLHLLARLTWSLCSQPT